MEDPCQCDLCVYFEKGGLPPSKGVDRKRFRLWIGQKRGCFYCEETMKMWNQGILEHIIPKSKGGDQIVLACPNCDKFKKDMHTAEEFDREIQRMVKIKKKVLAAVSGKTP